MKKEDFEKYYYGLSNVERLKIIEERDKYQPAAIEVAQEILSTRGYHAEESDIAKREIDLYLDKKKQRQEKINKRIAHMNELIDDNFGIKEKTSKKILNLFCLAIFLYALIDGFFQIDNMAGYFTSPLIGYSFAILLYLFQLLIIYLLYKRNSLGWILFVGLYTLLSVQNMVLLINNFQYQEFIFFAPPNPYEILITLCVHLAIIVFLNTKKIREQFTLSKIARIETLVISAIISGLLITFLRYS